MEEKTCVRALSLPQPGPSVNKTRSAISTQCDCAWSPVQAAAHTEIKWAQRCQEWNKDGIKMLPFFYPDHVCVVFDMCNGVSFGERWGCKSFWHSRLGHYTLLYFYMVCQFSRICTSEACCRDDLNIWITPLYVWAAPSRIYSHSHKSIVQFFKLTF